MKSLFGLLIALFVAGCAHGKIGQVDQALSQGAIDKTTPIYVEPVSAKDTHFSGDKAADMARVSEERSAIEESYNKKIAEALRKKGYNAKAVNAPVKSGLALSGNVTKFEHGSAAARMMVGMGAGSSNIFTNLKLEDRSAAKTLTKFEVIATSGATGGAGSYMQTHLIDGATKIADFIDKSNSPAKNKE